MKSDFTTKSGRRKRAVSGGTGAGNGARRGKRATTRENEGTVPESGRKKEKTTAEWRENRGDDENRKGIDKVASLGYF
jgi:hypothetical protein